MFSVGGLLMKGGIPRPPPLHCMQMLPFFSPPSHLFFLNRFNLPRYFNYSRTADEDEDDDFDDTNDIAGCVFRLLTCKMERDSA